MARRQTEIPGTERTDVPASLLEAGELWLDTRRTKRRASDQAKEAKLGVLQLMAVNKIPKFTLTDPESQEVMELEVDTEPKLRTKKTAEMEPEPIGDGIPSGGDSGPGVHPGLIAQAERDAEANGVSETIDGDVVPPDRAAPKKKRGPKKQKQGN